jgi:hypothetical protein
MKAARAKNMLVSFKTYPQLERSAIALRDQITGPWLRSFGHAAAIGSLPSGIRAQELDHFRE